MDITDTITKALAVAGAVSGLLTLLGTVLPSGWAVTQTCARFGADLRNIIVGVKR